MLYDGCMVLHSFEIHIIDGSKYIATIFNTKIQKIIYIIYVYKAHTCLINAFLKILQTLIQKSHIYCLIIVLGDFYIYILGDNNDT